MKLCQLIAIEKGVKQRANKEGGDILKCLQKANNFTGRLKTYTPLDAEDSDTQPDEEVHIQNDLDEEVSRFKTLMAELWDVVISKDVGNQEASAVVKVDGVAITDPLPATSLVFLEKQLDDIHKVVSSLPVLSTACVWSYDENQMHYVSKEVIRNRTKKVVKPVVLYDATDKHPAQTQLINEDVVVGHYSEHHTASMITRQQAKTLLDRVHKLKDAVKKAREEANAVEVKKLEVGDRILNFIFGESLVAS